MANRIRLIANITVRGVRYCALIPGPMDEDDPCRYFSCRQN